MQKHRQQKYKKYLPKKLYLSVNYLINQKYENKYFKKTI